MPSTTWYPSPGNISSSEWSFSAPNARSWPQSLQRNPSLALVSSPGLSPSTTSYPLSNFSTRTSPWLSDSSHFSASPHLSPSWAKKWQQPVVDPPRPEQHRSRSETPSTRNKRRREQSEPLPHAQLDEENQYIVQLREKEGLPWKEIGRRFSQTFGRTYQTPALQMRYGRLKNRQRPWTEADDSALQMAHNYYANMRYEIIAEKVRHTLVAVGCCQAANKMLDARIWSHFRLDASRVFAQDTRIGERRRRGRRTFTTIG